MVSHIHQIFETFRVALILTERCNVKCNHCWLESGPDKKAQMELDEALSYIDQAEEIPTVEWISLTGGEPFLLPEMLLRLVEYASGKGLRTECVTNCFWAETGETAERELRGLMEAGLDVINISADDFHQHHIPFERVRNCYTAAKRLGLKIVIMCTLAQSSRLNVREIAKLLGDEDICLAGPGTSTKGASALAAETGFIPAGRAAKIPKDEWLIGSGTLEGSCKVVLRDVTISPLGTVLACCSAAGLVEVAEVGSARHDRLLRLIEAAGQRMLFEVLSTEGPLGVQRRLGLGLQRKYVNKCHLCYEVLSDPCFSRVL